MKQDARANRRATQRRRKRQEAWSMRGLEGCVRIVVHAAASEEIGRAISLVARQMSQLSRGFAAWLEGAIP